MYNAHSCNKCHSYWFDITLLGKAFTRQIVFCIVYVTCVYQMVVCVCVCVCVTMRADWMEQGRRGGGGVGVGKQNCYNTLIGVHLEHLACAPQLKSCKYN